MSFHFEALRGYSIDDSDFLFCDLVRRRVLVVVELRCAEEVLVLDIRALCISDRDFDLVGSVCEVLVLDDLEVLNDDLFCHLDRILVLRRIIQECLRDLI